MGFFMIPYHHRESVTPVIGSFAVGFNRRISKCSLSLWTLVPFKQSLYVKRNVAKANKEKQLVNRQLKLTANEPVMAKSH